MCKPTGYFSRSKLYGHTKLRIPGLQPGELIWIPPRGNKIQSRATRIQSRKKLHARFRVEESGKPVQGTKEPTTLPTAISASQPRSKSTRKAHQYRRTVAVIHPGNTIPSKEHGCSHSESGSSNGPIGTRQSRTAPLNFRG